MIRIAITGSIGMGKSTVASMFARAGIPVFDADAEVRRLQGPGGALVERIGEHFPGTVESGVLDRDKLANVVLEDRQLLAEAFMAKHRDAPALLFDIPLLFETGGEKEFDKTVVVSAPAPVQGERVLGRSGMTAQKLQSILQRQMPDDQKRERADFVVDTSGDLSTTEAQVRDILTCLGLGAGR
jgi:dephospho-CoA kinase